MELKLWYQQVGQRAVRNFNRTNMELKLVLAVFIAKNRGHFNRTNMELKHGKRNFKRYVCKILIAPIWNWNAQAGGSPRAAGKILIAPIWNWNICKLVKCTASMWILIAPIWNWNEEVEEEPVHKLSNFNRTNMELKLISLNTRFAFFQNFNRTNMELKLL